MWAVGCVFGELLQMLKKCQPDPRKRKPLFPGSSCYPLSPANDPILTVGEHQISPCDQLNIIFSTLGNPSLSDITYLNDHKAEAYVNKFPRYPKVEMATLFPGIHPQAAHLLEKLLTFNPYFRITAKEALRHKYFEEVRDKTQEMEFPQPIALITDTYMTDNLKELVDKVILFVYNYRRMN